MNVPSAPARRPFRFLGIALATVAAVAIAWLTLTPAPVPDVHVDLTCVVCGPIGVADLLANVLLFLPFGFGLALSGLSWRKVAVIALGVSASIELTQYFAVTGRFATLGDLLTNTAGGTLGGLMAAQG